MLNEMDVIKRRDKLLSEVDISSPQALVKSIAMMISKLELTQENQTNNINQIKKLLEVRDIVLSDAEKLPDFQGVSSLLINADMPMEGRRGFYELEFNSIGTPYRWTGPDTAFSFRLLLDRSQDLVLRLTGVNTLDDLNREAMKCSVNRVPVEFELEPASVHGDESVFVFSGILPALTDEQKHNSSSLVEFIVPSVVRPSDLWEDNTDERYLGIAFKSFEISSNQ